MINDADDLFLAEALAQLNVFCRDLDALCRTIEPVSKNFDTYGHDIRNLLIIACTEVEAHWKGVLRANGRDDRSTNGYVLLQKAMRLGDYKLRYRKYPRLPAFSPFQDWGTGPSPTTDLQWYDAYNHVKHDRELEFDRATLKQVFNAVAACAIMLVAQFGYGGLGYRAGVGVGLLSDLVITQSPEWSLEDRYIDYADPPGSLSTAVNYPF